EEDRAALYLGFRNGHVQDQRYQHFIGHIYSKTNDLAFFAAKVCADLQDHGKKLSALSTKECRKEPPYINEMKFDTPRAKELMPPETAYSDYLSMYQQVEPKKQD